MSETFQKKLVDKNAVQDVIDFSNGLYLAGGNGIYSPWLQNQLLNSLNNNPNVPKMEELTKALSDYKNSSEDIQSYMDFMKHWDMIFARTIQFYANMLSFDLQIVCSNANKNEEYKSEKYKIDKQKIYKFLDAFDYKAEFRKAVIQMMTTETAYYWFRKTKWNNKGMKGTLQLMPQKYCMLTGYWEKGLLYDFNMLYFLQPGVNIDGFDPKFKSYYKNVFHSEDENYNPVSSLNTHDGTYAAWTQTSPADGAWANLNNSR